VLRSSRLTQSPSCLQICLPSERAIDHDIVRFVHPASCQKVTDHKVSPCLQICLLSEGHVVYFGPRERVLEFFELCGFKIPGRKGVADFLQEVTSKKDQEVR
jgi:hypothetical protein